MNVLEPSKLIDDITLYSVSDFCVMTGQYNGKWANGITFASGAEKPVEKLMAIYESESMALRGLLMGVSEYPHAHVPLKHWLDTVYDAGLAVPYSNAQMESAICQQKMALKK